MRSRLALMAVLALGILMSGSGATLAITGAAGDDDASVAQYGTNENGNENEDNLAGAQQGGGDSNEPEQVAATGDSGSSLPFTGFLAIPLLLGGVALTGTGFVLRRKASEHDSA